MQRCRVQSRRLHRSTAIGYHVISHTAHSAQHSTNYQNLVDLWGVTPAGALHYTCCSIHRPTIALPVMWKTGPETGDLKAVKPAAIAAEALVALGNWPRVSCMPKPNFCQKYRKDQLPDIFLVAIVSMARIFSMQNERKVEHGKCTFQ